MLLLVTQNLVPRIRQVIVIAALFLASAPFVGLAQEAADQAQPMEPAVAQVQPEQAGEPVPKVTAPKTPTA